MKRIILFLSVSFIIQYVQVHRAQAQAVLRGVVHEEDHHGVRRPLVGANVYWLGTSAGVSTDARGEFTLARTSAAGESLIVSFVGLGSDTLGVAQDQESITHLMRYSQELEGVVHRGKARGTYFDRVSPIQAQVITRHELQRAACCNLSESFETNASVDVLYTDAVTGAKQIQLLGLAGKYSQIQIENIPTLRGLSAAYGLGQVPGSWMESIQVSKGTASVANGYESISGQINVEYKKPWADERFFLNGYANSLGMVELNTNASLMVTPKVSTMVLAHVERMDTEADHDHNGFIDHPRVEQYHLYNRWAYQGQSFEAQAGLRLLEEGRISGQKGYSPGTVQAPGNPYGIDINTRRLDAFIKAGYIFDRPATSAAIIASATDHFQESTWGPTRYDGRQSSLHTNLIYLSYIGRTNHIIKTGANLNVDIYDEQLNSLGMDREEVVPGAYLEYTYKWMDDITLMGGVRYDYHSIHGGFVTPRAHALYNINEFLSVRASVGKGFRSPNLIAENTYLLASSRELVFVEDIRMEEAWNYGVNLIQRYPINGRELTLSTDYYRINFMEQLVVDMDQDPTRVFFYNLDGKSFSNSFQAELSYMPINRLDVTMAYRLNDVWETTNGRLMQKPLVSRNRGFLTLGYRTPLGKWQADYTVVYNGAGRLPSTANLPPEFQRGDTFPSFVTMNAQVTKYFRRWDAYIGVENITGFTQKDPILSANNPYGPYFDASMVWGPLSGPKIYVGFRLSVKGN